MLRVREMLEHNKEKVRKMIRKLEDYWYDEREQTEPNLDLYLDMG